MLPPDIRKLHRQFSEGPIVVLNISRYRSDAILVTQDRISALPLPGCEHVAAASAVDVFHEALNRADQSMVFEILEWLWGVVAEPVLGHLGLLVLQGQI